MSKSMALAAVATLFALPLAAQSNESSVTVLGEGNEATVTQVGEGNLGVIGQLGTGNSATLEQTGSYNLAGIVQAALVFDAASAHLSDVFGAIENPVIQNGSYNTSDVEMWGDLNIGGAAQLGTENYAKLAIAGTGNGVATVQIGDRNDLFVHADADGGDYLANIVAVGQAGEDNMALVDVGADQSSMVLVGQLGHGNDAWVDVDGATNFVLGAQYGDDQDMNVDVYGQGIGVAMIQQGASIVSADAYAGDAGQELLDVQVELETYQPSVELQLGPGEGNEADAHVFGFYNGVAAIQWGTDNDYDIWMDGSQQIVALAQIGDNNDADIRLFGDGTAMGTSVSAFGQIGSGNMLTADIEGTDQMPRSFQIGFRNEATFTMDGAANTPFLLQTGTGNMATFDIGGTCNTATVTQTGGAVLP